MQPYFSYFNIYVIDKYQCSKERYCYPKANKKLVNNVYKVLGMYYNLTDGGRDCSRCSGCPY